MSGHSKWSQIKRQKKATDQKRGLLFSKLAKSITLAVRQGGGITDPNINYHLRFVIERAKQANMPKDGIKKAIERAKAKEGEQLKEVIYEGYGPGKIALLIEVATNKHVRTMQQIKQTLRQFGGQMAERGAVSYLFEKRGIIIVKKGKYSDDEIFNVIAESEARDLDIGESIVEVYTEPERLHEIKENLEEKGLKISDVELTFQPQTTVVVKKYEVAKKVLALMDALEDLEDVQKVHANFDIPDRWIKEFSLSD